MQFTLSTDEAPRAWTLPGDLPVVASPWRDRIATLDGLPPGTLVEIRGGEPLCLPDLHDLLDAFDERGLRAALHTDLPTLDDDVPLRPFARHDVRFVVRFPTADPERFAALTGGDLERVEQALRNVRAFGYPSVVQVPLLAPLLDNAEATILHVLTRHSVLGADLCVADGTTTSADAVPTWDAVGAVLLALEAQNLKPRPRLRITGIPALALPLTRITRLHLDVDPAADTAWRVPEAYRGVHGDVPEPRDSTLTMRRAWLALDPLQRPGSRGDPRDRLVEATSCTQVREGHEVHALVTPLPAAGDVLARADRHGLVVFGRFDDPALGDRFERLQAVVSEQACEQTQTLEGLRELAHVLRRGMKPERDGADDPV